VAENCVLPHCAVRERLEARERALLAPWAMRSAESRGRLRPEPESPVRTAFQRDRDRIIHSNAFRRLKHKTQVFIAPRGEHYATRLSHAIEVAQIARTIARALSLNEDLAEAIALGHDLGHAPFGHAGQAALDALHPGGFRHNEQSLRVVDVLEKEGQGLNLSWEVRDGIRTHRKPRTSVAGIAVEPSSTLEAEVVKLADAIAYINHDIDDAVRAQLIESKELPSEAVAMLGTTRSARINTLVCDIVDTSSGRPLVAMSTDILAATDSLRAFLFERVYTSPIIQAHSERARRVVCELYLYFCQHCEELPPLYRTIVDREGAERAACDYIAGMTDRYALETFERLFIPKMWSV
jgi:dGTPase